MEHQKSCILNSQATSEKLCVFSSPLSFPPDESGLSSHTDQRQQSLQLSTIFVFSLLTQSDQPQKELMQVEDPFLQNLRMPPVNTHQLISQIHSCYIVGTRSYELVCLLF